MVIPFGRIGQEGEREPRGNPDSERAEAMLIGKEESNGAACFATSHDQYADYFCRTITRHRHIGTFALPDAGSKPQRIVAIARR